MVLTVLAYCVSILSLAISVGVALKASRLESEQEMFLARLRRAEERMWNEHLAGFQTRVDVDRLEITSADQQERLDGVTAEVTDLQSLRTLKGLRRRAS